MRNPYFIPLVFAVCLSAGLCQTPAHAGEISVRAEVDRALITIGDPVVYTVTIRSHPDIQVLSGIPMPDEEVFKLKKIEEFTDQEGDDRIIGRRFTLTAYRLGEFILEPVEIQYRDKTGETKTIQTKRIFITVKSVAAGETKTDIRGAKGVMAIPFRIGWPVYLVLALMLIALTYYFWRLLSRKRKMVAAPEVLLTPEEEALLNLQDLFESDFIRLGKYREYYFRFSEILRVYLEKRFGILAVESTTLEISRALKRMEIELALRDKIRAVLEAADLAKFAKWKPEPAQIVHWNNESKGIIEASRPKEAADGV